MLVPLHLKHKSPAGASACQPVIHSPFGVGGSREEKKKAGKRSPLLAGTESVRAWVGRVAERAKQAPGMSSVGVRMGGEEWDEGEG